MRVPCEQHAFGASTNVPWYDKFEHLHMHLSTCTCTPPHLQAAEARSSSVEAAFQEFRTAQRATPEAKLQLELMQAQQAAAAAESRAQHAQTAKKKYKEQVLQLVKELAALHQQRAAEAAAAAGAQQLAATTSALVATAEDSARWRGSQGVGFRDAT